MRWSRWGKGSDGYCCTHTYAATSPRHLLTATVTTTTTVKALNKRDDPLVFLLWGKPAQAKGKGINSKRHFVLACAHPSPLSATRTATPFIGSKCFSKTNAILTEKLGQQAIDWSLPGVEEEEEGGQ